MKAKIHYFTLTDEMTKEEKLQWFAHSKLKDLPMEHIQPDKDGNWLNITDNDWEDLVPVCTKETKAAKSKEEEKAIFGLYSNGVVTARDSWSFDYNKDGLIERVKYFIDVYNRNLKNLTKKNLKKDEVSDFVSREIKWTSELESYMYKKTELVYSKERIRESLYRPFTKQYFYFDNIYSHRPYQNDSIFGIERPCNNFVLGFSGLSSSKPFHTLVSNSLFSFDFLEKTQCLPLYRYDGEGKRLENITDWGLGLFREHYGDKKISKEDIFHYTYGVLHCPAYRQKYEINLKRDFPRLPFYEDFWQWAAWGKSLMELHIGFEEVEPYDLSRSDSEWDKERSPKPKLRQSKADGSVIELDEQTDLQGVPDIAWDYKLGNRSAIAWVLDQHKEKKPKDPTIRDKFNTYRFADYKEKVVDLLKRVCTVSVQTMGIIEEMETAGFGEIVIEEGGEG